jgi:S-adenosylmethionine hydrolase
MPLRPVITLTTDFGTTDFYVAAMKAALLRHCPDAHLIDVTHEIPAQDIVAGAFMLERAVASFDAGTIHLAVVDPGVGTNRQMLIAEVAGSTVVCPDNGLLTWTTRRHKLGKVFSLDWRPESHSNTFHGRDIMAPVAGQLAAGASPAQFGRPFESPKLLDLDLKTDGTAGVIIHTDRYGNATTNIPAEAISNLAGEWWVGSKNIGPLRQTYADVAAGEPIALIGSSGLLEIAVRNGSAAAFFELKPGDAVHHR